jgi:tetratricopeptide (TPR) repeat protein
MYRNMSKYGKGSGSGGSSYNDVTAKQQRPVVNIPTTMTSDGGGGLDDDYDYTQAYSEEQQQHGATTPTPTSASARGVQQNQYYQPTNTNYYTEQNEEEEDDDLQEYDANEQNDNNNYDDNNNINNNNNDNDNFIPVHETEETIHYDATNVIDSLVANHNKNNGQEQQQHHPPQQEEEQEPPGDTIFDNEQLEQLQIEAERLKATGNKHMASQEYIAAYHAYSAALQLSPIGPNSHIYLSNRSAALLSLKRYSSAAIDAKRAIALAPTFGKAHARLGQSLYFLKDYQNAVLAYQDAILYEPDNVVTRAYLEKAQQKLYKQQQQEAQQQPAGNGIPTSSGTSIRSDDTTSIVSPSTTNTIQNSITTDPMEQHHTMIQHPYTSTNPSTRAALLQSVHPEDDEDDNDKDGVGDEKGPVQKTHGSNDQQAMNTSMNTTTTSLIQQQNYDDPEFVEAIRIQQRANQFLVTKQYRQAIEEYTAALFLVPDDVQLSPDLHLGRAHALNGSRRHESARNDALLALKLQPNSPAAYSTLAKSLFYLKDYNGAIVAFDNCNSLLPDGETLGLFDQAYYEKAQRALEEEESSLSNAGKVSTPNRNMNRSFQSNSTTSGTNSVAVPKLPPPRFVPREEAIQLQATTPPARAMPKEWPSQSSVSPHIPLRCGPERTITFISEALGLKLNRGSDGIVRVLSVADSNDPNNVHILRQGTIEAGDIIREAAGVDIRRPITNVMWGDTVALLRMAPRPITMIVASELSPTPHSVVLEQQRANSNSNTKNDGATADISPIVRPSPSSGDEKVQKNRNDLTVTNETTEQINDLELITPSTGIVDNAEDEDIVEYEDESPDTGNVPKETSDPTEETNNDVVEGKNMKQPSDTNDENIVVVVADNDDDDDDGIESVDDEPSPSSVVLPVKKKATKVLDQSSSPIDQEIVFDTVQSTLRFEEDKIVGGEILFLRDTLSIPAYCGWDTLRWMAYNGARKVNFCQIVYKLEDGKRKGLPLFWKTGNKNYVERALIVYDEPCLMMIVRRPTSLDEIRNLLGLPNMSDETDESGDGKNDNDWLINPDTAMKSYWVLESVADPKTSKLQLSSLTTPTSISSDTADERERSCFHLLTPTETITLSALNVRTGIKKQEQSFTDSGAFLETLSIETSIAQVICGAHIQSSDLGNNETDIAWKHQVIIGSLHSLVLSGNPKLLDDGISHARMALLNGNWNGQQVKQTAIENKVQSTVLPTRIVDAVDDNGYTALYYACTHKMEGAVRSLIYAGADVNFRTDAHGLTMLHVCARKLDDKTLSTILSALSTVQKLYPNVLDKKGRTAMYVAMVEGSVLDGGNSPTALGRCMTALMVWGGYMMPKVTNASSSEILRNPISALAYMWLSEYLIVAFEYIPYRFPLTMNEQEPTTMSLGALYQYPLHSALIGLRKNLRKTTKAGVSLLDCGLLATLTVLLERGFEPNERLDTRAFGSTRTSFDEFLGFAPIQILSLMVLEMDVYKNEIDENTLNGNMELIRDAAILLLKNGARLSLDPPLSLRPREKISIDDANDSTDTVQVDVESPRRIEILTKKIESDKVLVQLLGGEKVLLMARKEWCTMKKVATMVTMNLADDNSVFENATVAGGSDTVSCAICWSVFGTLLNRRHKCRVSYRYVCDDCSAKRLVQVCSEYRLSDGQFNLARMDAIHEQQGRKVITTPTPATITKVANQSRASDTSSKSVDESHLAVRLERLEAEQQSNRESLFGGVLEAATNFVMGNDDVTSNTTTTSTSMDGLTESLDQTRNAFHERGERLAALNDKSAKMVDASSDFAKMAKELRKQSEKGFFW